MATITKQDIQKTADDLSIALKRAESAKEEANKAEATYQKLLEDFEKQHPDIVTMREQAKKSHSEEAGRVKELRDQLKSEAEGYFDRNPGDKNPIDGVTYRVEKDIYVGALTVSDCVEVNATMFLKVDEKAVKQFVQANAEQFEGIWRMPHYLGHWFPRLAHVLNTVNKVTISNATLLKNALDDITPEPVEQGDDPADETSAAPTPAIDLTDVPF